MFTTKNFFIPFVMSFALFTCYAHAQNMPKADGESDKDGTLILTDEELLATLKFQQGKVVLADGAVEVNLPNSFRYLSVEDTEKVLVDGWGNPPGHGASTLGMIVPAKVNILGADGWGVIIEEYNQDGYIKDEDAEKIDYDELLKSLQKDEKETNAELAKEGYPLSHLLGWAKAPFYDKQTHKLHWAKEVQFDEMEENTLNYNIRILGRKGYLALNIVSAMSDFKGIDGQMEQILSMVNFTQGYRYGDFDSKVDNIAAYGIGALVAGKLAAKAGLFAKLALALKKLWILLFVALGGLLKKFFGKKNKEAATKEKEEKK